MSNHNRGYKIQLKKGDRVHFVMNNADRTLCGRWLFKRHIENLRDENAVTCRSCLKWDVAKEIRR